MSDPEYRGQIESISSLMRTDGVSPDETDPDAMPRYREFAGPEYGAGDESAARPVSGS